MHIQFMFLPHLIILIVVFRLYIEILNFCVLFSYINTIT